MAESESFSAHVDTLLHAIRPYGRAESLFPFTLDVASGRRLPGQALHQWFKAIVDQSCQGEPKLAAVEDHIAIFVRLGWDRTQLIYANIQTLVASCDLDEFYVDGSGEPVYLRLDFDRATLGAPFSHPLAHIHVDVDRWPRFALDGGTSGNIVMDYLEFLYRHYVPAKWRTWAERVWDQEFFESANENDENPFPIIMEAFSSNQLQILRDYSADLNRLKRTLRRSKDKLFDFHMDGADRELLEYPLAR
jgi:hypothetical protein